MRPEGGRGHPHLFFSEPSLTQNLIHRDLLSDAERIVLPAKLPGSGPLAEMLPHPQRRNDPRRPRAVPLRRCGSCSNFRGARCGPVSDDADFFLLNVLSAARAQLSYQRRFHVRAKSDDGLNAFAANFTNPCLKHSNKHLAIFSTESAITPLAISGLTSDVRSENIFLPTP